MKILFIALTLTLGLAAVSAWAQDVEGCESWPNVPVNITPVFDEPRYDLSQNIASMQAIASDRQHGIPEDHAVAEGLTRYQPVLEFRVPVVIETPPDGLSCAYVKRVDVTVGYHDVTVFIASEIPQGSCGFNETMGHEQKHVAVNRALLQEFVPLIEERLQDYLKMYGVFRTDNPAYAQQTLEEKLKDITDDIIAKMSEENVRRQRLVDSPQEYARLASVCNGQLTQIAASYRRTGR